MHFGLRVQGTEEEPLLCYSQSLATATVYSFPKNSQCQHIILLSDKYLKVYHKHSQ